MTQPPELSILVFSEDHGEQVEPALCALLKKMLVLVEPSCGTHRIEFLPADEDSRTALRGKRHGGRDAKGHLHRRLLAGKIADQIAKDICCLHDRHNLALAESAYPKEAAYGADASFRATTDRLRECPALRAALARTRAA